jgi:hypothetical protein
MEEEKKEGTKRRKGRKNNCFTGSSFECDIFFHKYTLLTSDGTFLYTKN